MEGEQEEGDEVRRWSCVATRCRVFTHVPSRLDLRGLDEENPPVGRLQPEDMRLLGVVSRTLGQGVVHADGLLGDLLVAPVVHLTHTHTQTRDMAENFNTADRFQYNLLLE